MLNISDILLTHKYTGTHRGTKIGAQMQLEYEWYEFLISQGSVATCLRWGGWCHMDVIANFIPFFSSAKILKIG